MTTLDYKLNDLRLELAKDLQADANWWLDIVYGAVISQVAMIAGGIIFGIALWSFWVFMYGALASLFLGGVGYAIMRLPVDRKLSASSALLELVRKDLEQ